MSKIKTMTEDTAWSIILRNLREAFPRLKNISINHAMKPKQIGLSKEEFNILTANIGTELDITFVALAGGYKKTFDGLVTDLIISVAKVGYAMIFEASYTGKASKKECHHLHLFSHSLEKLTPKATRWNIIRLDYDCPCGCANPTQTLVSHWLGQTAGTELEAQKIVSEAPKTLVVSSKIFEDMIILERAGLGFKFCRKLGEVYLDDSKETLFRFKFEDKYKMALTCVTAVALMWNGNVAFQDFLTDKDEDLLKIIDDRLKEYLP